MGGIVVFSDPYTYAADLRLRDQSTADKEPRIRPCPTERNQQATEVQGINRGEKYKKKVSETQTNSNWKKLQQVRSENVPRTPVKERGPTHTGKDSAATEAKRRRKGY